MITPANKSTSRKPLRLWPGIVFAIVLVLGRYVIPPIAGEAEIFSLSLAMIAVFAGMLSAVAIVVWWLFFSRVPWSERLGAIILMIVALFATSRIVHESIAGGMMGAMLYVYSIPVLSLALVVWAAATRRLSDGARRMSLVAVVLLACAPFVLIRTAGLFGSSAELHWRWTPTPEERLLAEAKDEPVVAPAPAPAPSAVTPPQAPSAKTDDKPMESDRGAPAAPPKAVVTPKTEPASLPATARPAEWPGFRGPARDGVVRGVRISTDWSTSPPVAMWRRPIGPGWSSFAVRGDFLYTQEQRGGDEIVASYKVSTGAPVWRHRDPVRFWESNGGAGPRATPTINKDRIYAFGATGILNALDADSGKVVWSRNVASDTQRRVPDWGFASSPLVVDDVVIVAASGTLAGYDVATGQPRWVGRRMLGSYSSPHLATIDGVQQVVLLSGSGAASFAPANGAVLWEHQWQSGGATIVQPAVTAHGDILVNAIAMTGGSGLRRLAVAKNAATWSVEERWTSNGLKPYFNDFVVHDGHAFGFDGSILACIDLENGTRKWKGGRYGNGQLVLLAEQNLLLVISEEGELALVSATADQFREIARFPALDGKTWNHPVVVRNILLVRNGEEMAAFRLAAADADSRLTDGR